MFTSEQKVALDVSMDIALAHEGENDARATTAYSDVFGLLESVLQGTKTQTDRAETLKEFTRITGLKAEELVENMNCPCLNSGQYARYLDVLDRAVELKLIKPDEFTHERIELLVCLGRRKEAEELGEHLLKSSPNDIMSYVIYGDIYYLFEYLNEHQDLQKAEDWYYQAYDRFGWPDEPNEDWEILVERLHDLTIEKLRRAAYRRLRELLEAQSIGSHETVYQLIRATWLAGHGNAVMSYIQNTLLSKIMEFTKSIEKANVAIKVLQDAYNLMPQQHLKDGVSAFDMRIAYPQGPHAERVAVEKNQAVFDYIHSLTPDHKMTAEDYERVSEIQEEFMQENDPLTGKRRTELLMEEQKEIIRRVEEGELVWTGFTEFRGVDEIV